jgi:hypothetical protein
MGQRRRALVGLIATVMLTGAGLTLTTGSAAAAPQRGIGHETTPAQPYKGNPDASDWLGSYMVGNKQVFCVQFAFLAPDSDEQYRPGEPLKTKWGTDLAPDVAANISYLLLRYAGTTSPDEAAALAHLLHSWTAAPQSPDQLLPSNDFRHIAYDANFHLTKLNNTVRATVERLRADATANHGPWTTALTKPTKPQLVGTPDNWTVAVRNAAGKGLAKVPVTVKVTDGVLGNGKPEDVLPTPEDGKDLVVPVTPTGPKPSVQISLASPAPQPVVQQAIQLDTQRIVSTGGEKQLTAKQETVAGGVVKVAKTNEANGTGIAGVALRVTGEDKVKPAEDQNGKPLVGADGKPSVVVTGPDGTAELPHLKIPQVICLLEVAAAPGFEQGFDPANPKSVCGKLEPGATLTLKLTNKPNVPTVPIKIPAGDQPQPVAHSTVLETRPPWAMIAIGGLVLVALGLTGFAVRRRAKR